MWDVSAKLRKKQKIFDVTFFSMVESSSRVQIPTFLAILVWLSFPKHKEIRKNKLRKMHEWSMSYNRLWWIWGGTCLYLWAHMHACACVCLCMCLVFKCTWSCSREGDYPWEIPSIFSWKLSICLPCWLFRSLARRKWHRALVKVTNGESLMVPGISKET